MTYAQPCTRCENQKQMENEKKKKNPFSKTKRRLTPTNRILATPLYAKSTYASLYIRKVEYSYRTNHIKIEKRYAHFSTFGKK